MARNPRAAVAGDGPPLGPQPIAGADEVAVPNRRTNREKVADLKRQGLTQAQVVKALGICKSRVSQLWPRTPEVQEVFAEEHAAEVREATAQRSRALSVPFGVRQHTAQGAGRDPGAHHVVA